MKKLRSEETLIKIMLLSISIVLCLLVELSIDLQFDMSFLCKCLMSLGGLYLLCHFAFRFLDSKFFNTNFISIGALVGIGVLLFSFYSFKQIDYLENASILSVCQIVSVLSCLFCIPFTKVLEREKREMSLVSIRDNVKNNNHSFYKAKSLNEELEISTSFAEFLETPELWSKILSDEKGKLYFNSNGNLLTDTQRPHSEICASLMYTLKKNNLFKEDYLITEQVEISRKFFNISTSIKDNSKRDNELFAWVVELHKQINKKK